MKSLDHQAVLGTSLDCELDVQTIRVAHGQGLLSLSSIFDLVCAHWRSDIRDYQDSPEVANLFSFPDSSLTGRMQVASICAMCPSDCLDALDVF